jgi:hypothetical protein
MTSMDPLQALLAGERGRPHFVVVHLDGSRTADVELRGVALLPGSFNPLHIGHEELAAVARQESGRDVLFELSVTNVDKPSLTEIEVQRRLDQFRGRWRVVLSRAPRFVEKARVFPESLFAIGWDTFVRLLDARYYDDTAEILNALAEIRDLGCRFLVAGRVQAGVFRVLEHSDVPAEFAEMFEALPESRFRVDISSTALRGQ